MRRAVHGLEAHLVALDVREVHVLAVHVPVAGLLEQLRAVEDRRVDLAVAAVGVLLAPQVGQLVPDRHPVREPERRAGRELGEHEQLELLAELAVVAGAGLLEPLEVLGELLLRRERGAVDAGEHLALGVAAPVGAGDRGELERLGATGPGRMRAAAEVEELAVAVEADGLDALIADQVLDQLDLVRLVLLQVELDRVAGGHLRALERLVGLDVLAHLGLDALEVALVDASRRAGTRSRSRSRPRSAGRSRPSCRDRARARTRRARARCRGAGASARRRRPAWR